MKEDNPLIENDIEKSFNLNEVDEGMENENSVKYEEDRRKINNGK